MSYGRGVPANEKPMLAIQYSLPLRDFNISGLFYGRSSFGEVLFLFYKQAVDYILNIEKFGSSYGLETVSALLQRLGNPQNNLKFVHIAGTNGKGSTSCFITNILIESGYKTGTFNSPSVFGYNERYLIDGKPVDDDSIAKYITIVAEERAKMQQEGLTLPTAFELEFAVAMLIFNDKHCDIAVLECGLGGRLDATNVIPDKLAAVITSISFDHTAILGNTLKEIATEKFAIVKDCPLITFNQCDEVMQVFEKAHDLRLTHPVKLIESSKDGQTFVYDGAKYHIKQLGGYQLQNCSLAIECASVLKEKGLNITSDSIKRGIENSYWKGRLQKIRKNGKTFILDGTHNPDGAKVLADELKLNFSDMTKCFVFGMFKDKDMDGVLSHIGPLADCFITITPSSERGQDNKITLSKCLEYTKNSCCADDMQSAICTAYNKDYPLIIVCGSLSILSSALQAINDIPDEVNI